MKLYHNEEWLRNKYIKEKLPIIKICKICDVSFSAVRYYLSKYNIPIRSKSEAFHLRQVNHCKLSQEAIEWINGELLGDGCLELASKYSAKFKYGSKYPEYIEYVKDILKSFGIKQAGKIYEYYNKKLNCYSYHYCSRSYPELLIIRKKWYPNNKKIIPKDIVLTPLTLRQHYIGDGCITHYKLGRSRIKLCTYGFPIIDVEYFLNKIKKLGIKATRITRNAICVSAYSTKDFLNYIGECPVECYKYKWRVLKYATILL